MLTIHRKQRNKLIAERQAGPSPHLHAVCRRLDAAIHQRVRDGGRIGEVERLALALIELAQG
jgi:hypothetical protein